MRMEQAQLVNGLENQLLVKVHKNKEALVACRHVFSRAVCLLS